MTAWQTFVMIATTLTVAGGLFAYTGWRWIAPAAMGTRGRIAAWTALVLVIPLNLASRSIGLSIGGRAGFALSHAAGFATGFLAFGLMLLVCRDAAWALALAADSLARRFTSRGLFTDDRATRRGWVRKSGVGVAAASLTLLAVGYVGARREPVLERTVVEVAGLPADLDGYRIAHITDVHLGGFTTGEAFRKVVDRVNALDPDLVAVTGDLGEVHVVYAASDAEPLGLLRARDGVFFVPGNHEVYAGVDEWVALVRALQVTALINEHRVIHRGAATLIVAGVPNAASGMHGTPPGAKGIAAIRSDPAAALAGAPPADFRILLAHQPSSAKQAERAGYDLLLAGHTHGGQFFPWNVVAKLAFGFVSGMGNVGHLRVYVSRGVGVYIVPARIGVPGEISLLELHRR
jgi:predicted MPP superfamily phosphohydrolase